MTKCLLEQPMAEQSSPMEEVQLTELRPVEHSRIKGVGGYEAPDTDAMRALHNPASKHLDEFEHLDADYPDRYRPQWDAQEKRLPGITEVSDEEDATYVNGDLEYLAAGDETYNYRHRDDCSPEIEGAAVESVMQPAAEETLTKTKKGKPGRPRGRPRKKKNTPVSLKKLNADRYRIRATEPKEAEAEFRRKMSEIIQSKLMERENNNIVDTDATSNPEEAPDSPEQPLPEQGKKHRCNICDAQFKGSGGLRNHYKVMHSDDPGYECDDCGKRFPLKERLKLHMRTHTGFKPYKCKTCEKCFARGGQLVQHERTHSKDKPFHCHLCTGSFTCVANLNLHVKRHNGQKDHKCDICNRAFVRRDALKKHYECLHQDLKSFTCTICNKTFKGHLPQHMRTHAKDRPHGCATCGQRFAQKSQLTVHQRTHSGQRPFRCLVCWQAFAHSTALKLHVRRHTGERPFRCVDCDAGFTQLPHWKKHMKCIHGKIDPYGCRWCDKHFRIKNELEVHMKECGKGRPDYEQEDPQAKVRVAAVERMRLLLAVILKRISGDDRLDELGYGRRLIDEVLADSLRAAGKHPMRRSREVHDYEPLSTNLRLFLEWTVPSAHWQIFVNDNKSAEEILETLAEPFFPD